MPALARFVPARSTLLLVAALAATPVARAQVCPGPVTLSSQAEVDAFDCTEVTSDLTIEGSDIVNLDSLASLTAVGDLLILYSGVVTDLTGLGGLTSVGGDLYIEGNYALTSLKGLGGLTAVGGDLGISNNNALTSLVGLRGSPPSRASSPS